MDVAFEDALEEYKEAAPMGSFLPIKFPKGSTVTEVGCVCSNCGSDIEEENVRGTIVKFPADLASLRGWAGCFECGLLSVVNARIRESDGTLIHEAMIDGKWHSARFAKEKESIIKKLKKWVGVKA